MNYLWALLTIWGLVLTAFILMIAYDEARYQLRRRRRRRTQPVDFTRKRLG